MLYGGRNGFLTRNRPNIQSIHTLFIRTHTLLLYPISIDTAEFMYFPWNVMMRFSTNNLSIYMHIYMRRTYAFLHSIQIEMWNFAYGSHGCSSLVKSVYRRTWRSSNNNSAELSELCSLCGRTLWIVDLVEWIRSERGRFYYINTI